MPTNTKNSKSKALKKSQKLPEKKGKSDIFNNGDKTMPAANQFAKMINARFIKALKSSNIPVLQEFATAKNVLDLYFMNRDMILYIMGDYTVIIDRMFRDIVADYIGQVTLERLENEMIPGYWSISGMTAIARRMINVINLVDRPELGAYLSAHAVDPADPVITFDMVKEYPAMTCMRFREFNPNRFYQFFTLVKESVYQIIATEVENNIPYANLVDPKYLKDTTTNNARTFYRVLYQRYGQEFAKYAKIPINEWHAENLEADDKTPEWKCKDITKVISNLIIGYATRILEATGLSKIAISRLFEVFEPKVSYTNYPTGTNVDSRVPVYKITILYKPVDTEFTRGPGARIIVGYQDIYGMVNNGGAASYISFGNSLFDFVHELMNITIAGYNSFLKPAEAIAAPEEEEDENASDMSEEFDLPVPETEVADDQEDEV